MTNNRTSHVSALDQYMQVLDSCHPLYSAEEQRLTSRMRRLREKLARIIDGLPETHRSRLTGGVAVRLETPFPQLEALVSALAREADERGDDRLAAPARRARAVLRVLASARSTLVTRNLRLVYHLARRLAGRGTVLSDVVQIGNVGLLEAADRFDPTRGVRFSTYAGTCIARVILREMPVLTQNVHIPEYQRRLGSRLTRSQRELTQDLGRDPTLTEVATQALLTEDQARDIIALKPVVVDLDAPRPGEDDRSLSEMLASDDSTAVLDRLIVRNLVEHLQDILPTLEPRMRTVLCLRYGLENQPPRTLREIGTSLRLSKERVRQLEEEALKLLRVRLRRIRSAGSASRASRARSTRTRVIRFAAP